MLNLSDDRVDPESSPLKHRDLVVIIDQVSLRTRLANGDPCICCLDLLLLFMHFLFSSLGLDCLVYIEFAKIIQIIHQILRDLNCLLSMQQSFLVSVQL